MTVSSVTEILTAKSADTLVTEQLAVMAAADPPLPVTAYQPGSTALTLIEAEAEALADVHTTVGQLGASAFLGEATDDWLTLRARSTFDVERILATYTLGTVTLACSALAGPETITPGALVISTTSGLLYRSTNTASITVASGGTASVPMRAEGSGTDYNVSLAGATIVTPAAAGLSVSAAALLAWITVSARNEETDPELRARCRARWSTLGSGFTRAAVTYWATSAALSGGAVGSAGCTRVSFAAPAGDGSYTVYVAGASGVLGAPGVAAVQAELDLRKPITDSPVVTAAASATVTVAGTVRFKSAATGAEQIAVTAAIRAYVDGLEMPDDGDTTTVDLAGIHAAVYGAAPGRIADVDLSSPASDTSVSLGSVAVADTSGVSFTV